MKFDSILGTVGNTPHVRINRLAPEHVNLYVKIEAFNPLGSVKDRLALGVIEAAEKSGELKPGQTVIEATSGNTGIGLAMVCAAKGYPFVVHHGGAVQRRAAQADAFPRRQGGDHARGRPRLRHGRESAGACQEERLVPDAPVRERSQSRHAFAHHGARDHRRLQGQARLLGHRLRHRRHAERRRARVREGNAQHQDRAVRAGRSADAHQRRSRRSATTTARRRSRTPHSSRIRCRAGARTSSRSSPAMRST